MTDLRCEAHQGSNDWWRDRCASCVTRWELSEQAAKPVVPWPECDKPAVADPVSSDSPDPLCKHGWVTCAWCEASEILLADTSDPVNAPAHYTQVPGVECIQVTEHFSFCRGNAIKYLWRAGSKGETVQDLQKAIFYIEREIASLTV